MVIAAGTRRMIFWGVDFVRGSRTRRALREITESLTGLESNSHLEMHNRRLESLLTHAVSTSEAYRGCSPDDLSTFPVTNKNTIRNNPTKYISGKYKGVRLRRRVTSGSTGTPFVSFQNSEKVVRNTADTIAFGRYMGYDIGAPVYYFTVWPRTFLSDIKRKLQNVTPVDVTRIDEELVTDLVTKLKRLSTAAHFIGYASAIERFCTLLDRQHISLPSQTVASVLATSETPSINLAEMTSNILGAPLAVRYSNIENGILGQQQPNTRHYRLNTSSYHFEVLDLHRDRPARPGTPGRIVITDLFNRAMPFIRYDTGDVGVLEAQPEERHLIDRLDRLEGRQSDLIYDTQNRLLSVHFVARVMKDFTDVRQYQLIQTGRGQYTIRLNGPHDSARDRSIIAAFKRELGHDAQIMTRHTEEVPLLASGKRRRIVSEWSPEAEQQG